VGRRPAEEPGARDLPEPARELEAGRTASVAGRFDEAVLHFGLALRLAPALAPAVLEATAGARALEPADGPRRCVSAGRPRGRGQRGYLAAARGGLPERRRRSRTRPPGPRPGATEWTDGTDGTRAATHASRGRRRRGPERATVEGAITTADAPGDRASDARRDDPPG
jgi:hypothetical protein